MGILSWRAWGTVNLFSSMAAAFSMPIGNEWRLSFLPPTFSQHLLVVMSIFLFQPSFWVGNGYQITVAVICISLKTWCWASFHSVQFSHTQLGPTLCDPMNCSMPGLFVHHHLVKACSNSHSMSSWCHPTNSSVLSFLMVQLSHPYMTTGKTIALTTWTFVGKVMSLLFNVHLGLSYLFIINCHFHSFLNK